MEKLNSFNLESFVFASKEDTHPSLQYLRIEEGKTFATDGHILIMTELAKSDGIEPNFNSALSLIRDIEPKIKIALDPAKAKKIFEFLTKFTGSNGKDRVRTVTLSLYEVSKPIKIEARNDKTEQNLVALLMPCGLEE